MKEVGIRDAQVHLTQLLTDLPFAITRFGKIIAYVSEKESGGYVKSEQKPVPSIPKIKKTESPEPESRQVMASTNRFVRPSGTFFQEPPVALCKHGRMPHLCEHRECRRT